MRLLPWILASLLAGACGPKGSTAGGGAGGGDPATARPVDLPSETRATLAGHRCGSETRCECRALGGAEDQAEGAPPEGELRRVELRLASSTGRIWVDVDDDRFFKSGERAEDCYYVDLAPGPHKVRMYAKADEPAGGVGVGFQLYEYAHEPGPYWYDSFIFQCGVPGPCDRETIASWKKDVQGDRRNLRDICGATRVNELQWETGRAPDTIHPEDLLLSFTFTVSPNRPSYPPRDPQCPEK